MKMTSKGFISAGLLSVVSALALQGCNMANSGDEPSIDPNSTLTQPVADIRVASSTRPATEEGYYYELTTLNVEAEAIGSMDSSVSCVVTFDYKISPTAEFVTKETKNSCEDYDFNLYSGPGVYRWSLVVTDGNGLLADDQMFATVISDAEANIYDGTEPLAEVTVLDASIAPDSNGYYVEGAIITVNTNAAGSSGSEYTCSTTLDHNNDASEEFANLDTLLGCGVKDFSLSNGYGTYQVKLVVTDDNSKVAEDQKYVIAIPQALADSIYLNAEFDFTVSTDPESLFDVYLDATTSSEGTGGNIVTYQWDVYLKEEDETTETQVETLISNSPTTTVTVDRDGIYVAKLTLTDDSEKTAVTEKMFMVSGTGATLIADFSVTIPTNAPVNIEVDAAASIVEAGIDHYEWEVYDMTADASPIYQLTVESEATVLPIVTSGNYLIRLTVMDVDGNEHEITRIITVP